MKFRKIWNDANPFAVDSYRTVRYARGCLVGIFLLGSTSAISYGIVEAVKGEYKRAADAALFGFGLATAPFLKLT